MSSPRTLPEALDEAGRGGAGYHFLADGADTFRPYAAIRRDALRIARALADVGLRRGDLVALLLTDAEAFLTSLFGASMAGVIPASLAPPATAAELRRSIEATTVALRMSGARAVLASRALVPELEAIRPQCPSLSLVLAREDLMQAPAGEPVHLPALDDIAFVQFTSGSTSAPKGVAITHANLQANVEAIYGPSGVAADESDSGVSWLPLHHDMGLVGMAIAPVYISRPAVLMPPAAFVKRPVEWLRAISAHRGTISFAPNFAYDLCVRRVKDRDLEELDLSCWRVAGCGAEPIHAPTLAAFARRFEVSGFRETAFLPCYGLAEHVLAATFAARGRAPRLEYVRGDDLATDGFAAPAPSDAGADGIVPLVSCGRPLPGHQLRIVDEDGRPLPERRIGEIVLAGPSVMLGYYNQAALTAETIRDGWLHTGDLGYLAGGELFVCGRAKDIIIVNGRKYHPEDLEWSAGDLAGVRRGRVAAFAVPAPGQPDRVVMVVEPSGTVRGDAIAEAIRQRVAGTFGLYVDEVAIVPSGTIGRTTSGKVQRSATRLRYLRGEFVAAPQAAAPAERLER